MMEMVDVWPKCMTHLVMNYLVRDLSELFCFIYGSTRYDLFK